MIFGSTHFVVWSCRDVGCRARFGTAGACQLLCLGLSAHVENNDLVLLLLQVTARLSDGNLYNSAQLLELGIFSIVFFYICEADNLPPF